MYPVRVLFASVVQIQTFYSIESLYAVCYCVFVCAYIQLNGVAVFCVVCAGSNIRTEKGVIVTQQKMRSQIYKIAKLCTEELTQARIIPSLFRFVFCFFFFLVLVYSRKFGIVISFMPATN